LAEIILAAHAVRGFPDLLSGWKKQGDQDTNDCDRN
jgi:hypothetical protein